jgi:mersacidin/lichenicidin family type 2 lantibiotic
VHDAATRNNGGIMSNLAPQTIVNSWRDQDFFESLDDSMKREIPANPAGFAKASPFPRKEEIISAITLLNDNCNLTMVGPDGCYF